MKISIVVYDKRCLFNLERVRMFADLKSGQQVLCSSPFASGVCRGKVVRVDEKYTVIRLIKEGWENCYFKIYRCDLAAGVFRIINQLN